MHVVSVNVGRPRLVSWRGKTVSTAIWKSPLSGVVAVRSLNLDGDRQSDLSVHGGPDKAVYAYPSEHYAFWREQLPDAELPWGAFGEKEVNGRISTGTLRSTVVLGPGHTVRLAEYNVTAQGHVARLRAELGI